MFTPEDRERIRERVLEVAHEDPRVVAGAVVGAQAEGSADRWSDLDLTFGVADGVPLHGVLEAFTQLMEGELDAVHLFDLPRGQAIYRVFLAPGNLQVDLSFAPRFAFGARGPRFALLFGEAVEVPQIEEPLPRDLFGLAAHHAVRARICIERKKLWQAERWISLLRDHALELACIRRGLSPHNGRGFDELPPGVLAEFERAIVRRLAQDELLRALAVAAQCLLREGVEAGEIAARLEPRLRVLTA